MHAFHRLRPHPVDDPGDNFEIHECFHGFRASQCTGIERCAVGNCSGSEGFEHLFVAYQRGVTRKNENFNVYRGNSYQPRASVRVAMVDVRLMRMRVRTCEMSVLVTMRLGRIDSGRVRVVVVPVAVGV